MTPEAKQKIDDSIQANTIMIFMKGSPDFPQCGFSAATVECFAQLGAKFASMNVLEDWEIREGIKEFSNWPTIPQVYIKGEFIGGCDIVRDLYASGELKKMVEAAG